MKKTCLLTSILLLISFIALCQKAFEINHGPYLQAMGETGVNIVWTTNQKAISWVELAPNDSSHFYEKDRRKYFAATNGLKKEAMVHNVRIDGLKPATTYRYRVYSQEVLSHESHIVQYGNVAATRAYRAKLPAFTTNNKAAETLNFAVINDIHQRNDVMKTLLSRVDWKNADCVFFNGDMQNNSRNEEQIFTSFMDTATQIFADHIHMYYARGNHETRGEFASEFPKYFPTESGRLYYILRNGPVCFVVLDTGEDKPDSDIEYSGITDFDEYRTQQAAWLKEALKSSDYITAPYKVVIGHIPPFGGWHGEKEVADKFIPLLNEAGAQIMIAAHLHRSLKKMPEASGAHFPILVNSNNSILKAKATKDELLIEMYDLEGKLMDSITIKPGK